MARRQSNGYDLTVTGATFSNMKGGIRSLNANVKSLNNTFINVDKPFDIEGGSADIQSTRIYRTTLDGQPDISPNKSTIGWSRTGPAAPAHCPECDTVFPSKEYDVRTSRFYSRDNKEKCPKCKYPYALVADGLYDVTAEAISILSGPDITYELLEKISKLAADVSITRLPSDEVLRRLDNIDVRLSELARKISNSGGAALAWFNFALGVAALCLSHTANVATIESLDLTREQTQLARAASSLPPAASVDDMLKAVARELSETIIMSNDKKKDVQPRRQKTSASPAKDERLSKSGATNLFSQKKPKARTLKRRDETDRRRAFNPRHQRPSDD